LNFNKKTLQKKIIDYKRFGFTLIALSTFLYLGVIIPAEGKTLVKIYMLMGGTVVMLGTSFLFFLKAIKYKKQLHSMEN
jgi:YrhC-like protein